MLSVGHELADPAWSFPRAKALIFHSTSNLGTDCCTTLTPYPYDQDAHTVELEFFWLPSIVLLPHPWRDG